MEQKEGTGKLWENKKEKDTHPDYTGHIVLDGKIRKLAMWVREARGSGKKYFYLSEDTFVPMESKQQGASNGFDESERFKHMPQKDDIPF